MKIRHVLSLSFLILSGVFTSAQTPALIFEARFDSTLITVENETPTVATGLSFEDGISGKGVLIEEGDILQYPIMNNISSQQGSLSLWVQPKWNPGEILYRIFVLGNDPRNFELHLDEGKQLAFAVNVAQIDSKPIKVAFGSADNWKENYWYFLTYTWNSDVIKLFVNGENVGEEAVAFDIPMVTEANFHVGSLDGEEALQGVIDDLKIYDAALSSEEIQMKYEEDLENLRSADAITLTDIFGRNITHTGITLVDWEGPVSNPAFKYFLHGDESLSYPVEVNLSTNQELTYFNLPSTAGKNGPAKTIRIESGESVDSILFSIYMDKNYDNESFDLTLQYDRYGIPAKQMVPVTVIDQDYDRPLTYPVIVDFSMAVDSLLLNTNTQEVITEAAENWLYYVDGEGIDSVEAGGSSLTIGGQDHQFEEMTVSTPVAYKGYYLYAYGNTNNVGPCFCSTGFPNLDKLQTRNGVVVPVPRIGGLHLNLYGQDYGEDVIPGGWEVLSPYEDWTFHGYPKVDLYSIAKHEIGHAMVFEELPLFDEAQNRLGFTSQALSEYYPDSIVPLFPESLSHIYKVLDPASLNTPYGGGVDNPIMASGREMLTKLDVLIMESVGYPIRDNEVTRALSLTQDTPLSGEIDQLFEAQLAAKGGIPVYHFEIVQGELPQGLVLDEISGRITGTPQLSGKSFITFLVRDYNEASTGVILETVINIIGETTSQAELINFDIDGQIGETVLNDLTNTVTIVMPAGTDLTDLKPIITISAGATISPGDGVSGDFSGSVKYIITSEDGTVQNTWTVTAIAEVATGVNNNILTNFSLYPNPVTDLTILELQLAEPGEVSLTIFDSNGRIIDIQKLGKIDYWSQWLDLSDLKTGVYLMHITSNAKSLAVKRIIKR